MLNFNRRLCVKKKEQDLFLRFASLLISNFTQELRERMIRGLSSSNPLQLHAGTIVLGMAYIPIPWHGNLWAWGQSRWPCANTRTAGRGGCRITNIWAVVCEKRKTKRKRICHRKGLHKCAVILKISLESSGLQHSIVMCTDD